MKPLWVRIAGDTKRLTAATVVAMVVGVLVIAVGNRAGWGWTRVIGATLISIGGLGFGAVIAFVEPRRERLRAEITRQRTLIAIVAALVLVLPVAVALAAAVVGLFLNSGGGAGLRTGGTLVGLFLLIASVASTVIAVRATRRALPNVPALPSLQVEEDK